MTTLALTADSTLGQLCYIRFARVLTCRFYLSFPHSVSFLLSLSCFRRDLTDPSSLGFALRMIYPHNPVNSQHHSRASAPTTEPCPPFSWVFSLARFLFFFRVSFVWFSISYSPTVDFYTLSRPVEGFFLHVCFAKSCRVNNLF